VSLPYQTNPLLRLGSPTQIAAWWIVWAVLGLPALLWFRWRPGGGPSAAPRRGPFLLLANHTAVYDPVWVAWWTFRRVSYMSLETLFHHWFLGVFLPLVGCFPKAYAVKDRASMAQLAERYEAGEGVVIFPEGGRSWDGRPGEVLPGIGRLIKRLGTDRAEPVVVLARVETGHLFHPRWARYPRWVPVRIRYARLPRMPDASPEAITEAVRRHIAIDPDVDAPGLSFGWRMAHGLPDYLWACPACFAAEGLSVADDDGDSVRCRACERRWRLDTSNRMNGEPTLRVTEAYDRVIAHFGEAPTVDPERFARDGVLLECERASVKTVGASAASERVASGRLTLTPEGITVSPDAAGERAWRAPFSEISVVAVAFGGLLTVRVGGVIYGMDLKGGNALMWDHIVSRWLQAARREVAL